MADLDQSNLPSEGAAGTISKLKISESEMESVDHVDTYAERTSWADSTDTDDETTQVCAPRSRPVPPPLTELDSPKNEANVVPAVPAWTPKVGTADAAMPDTPEAPAWSPKVGSSGMMQCPAPPPAPAPPSVPQLAPAFNPVPLTQDQLDSLTQDISNQELNMVRAVPIAPQPPQVWWYRVSFLGGIALRTAPNVESMCTGWMLAHNEIFAVCERIQGMDGRVYLLLSDRRGWAFDDSALIPHDPSVVHGRFMQVPVEPQAAYPGLMPVTVYEQSLAALGMDDAKKNSRRRKRGGVKRNKNKSGEPELFTKAERKLSEAELDTDEPAEAAPAEADSSNSELEGEGAKPKEEAFGAIFKKEDFPQLLSTV